MDVIFSEVGNAGMITLNRPKQFNALTYTMAKEIVAMLKKWERSKAFVIIKSSSDKVFCSGGDIRSVVESRKRGEKKLSLELQQLQHVLCNVTKNYKIPYIALINGIMMGGGCSLAVHGKYCVITENAVFAMPEASIGFVPDVGSSYFLPRLSGKLGMYLALTAQRLKGADIYRAGIGTHFCSSTDLKSLEQALLRCNNEYDINKTLTGCLKQPIPEFTLKNVMPNINAYFHANCVEDILVKLRSDDSDWAKKILKAMEKVSPTSLKVVFKEMSLGRYQSFKECLQMEYRLASNCLDKTDFYEGVRATIIDKDLKPIWNPSTLAEVSPEYVNEHFKPAPTEHQLLSKL